MEADFARVAGFSLVNYWWDIDRPVDNTLTFTKDNISLETMYYGVNCRGQTDPDEQGCGNLTTKLILGGEEEDTRGDNANNVGHGGTATGLVVRQMGKYSIGSALFAPGWAYEHFPQGRDIDRFMWEGIPDLNQEPTKSKAEHQCTGKSQLQQHFRWDLKNNHITEWAKRSPAGSTGFFFADYTQAVIELPSGQYGYHLGQQSILPLPSERSDMLFNYFGCDTVGEDTRIIEALIKTEDGDSKCSIGISALRDCDIIGTRFDGKLILHRVCAEAVDLKLELSITYKRQQRSTGWKICLYTEYGSFIKGRCHTLTERPLPMESSQSERVVSSQIVGYWETYPRITAIGISISGDLWSLLAPGEELKDLAGKRIDLLDIYDITLKPVGHSYPTGLPIGSVKFESKGSGISTHHRLAWSIPQSTPSSSHLPWSNITGPFSYFRVQIDGQWLGRAYALEYIVDSELYEGWKVAERSAVSVAIRGYSFDGTLAGEFEGAVLLV